MTNAKPPRRFPAPWQVVVLPGGYAVEDATGQRLGTFYGRADPQSARLAGVLTLDEARRMALNFAKLPELLKRPSPLALASGASLLCGTGGNADDRPR